MSGAQVIAQTLKDLGVKHIFGLVGIPVIEVAQACIDLGINFIAFRNEQSAAYAASIYGYLTGLPGVCLAVGGPGVVHALAGLENAKVNRLPLLLLAGSSETHQRAMGAFQQLDQVSIATPFTKFSQQPASLAEVPRLLEQAYRTSYFGQPGATYIDLPADLIQSKGTVDSRVSPPGAPPLPFPDLNRVQAAADLLKSAKAPLIVIGKGAAYARAEKQLTNLVESLGLPFLPTPMGKGVVPDSSSLNVSAARSAALASADVIIVFGARLNWILHYGMPPKFSKDVKIVQVDSVAEELGNNAGSSTLGILGDAGETASALLHALKGWKSPGLPKLVVEKRDQNGKKAHDKEHTDHEPLLYEPTYRVIRDTLAENTKQRIVYVSEGANTMDISRTSFGLETPRTRLDAGTNATMGVGLGYAIAAKAADPDSLVVAIEGDSAFGFSAVEVETAVRHDLPMIIYVMNNSGVYHGVDPRAYSAVETRPLPPTALSHETEYHKTATSLGALGFVARTLKEVKEATVEALKSNKVALINVILDPGKDKKLEFGWMASAKM